MTYIPERLRQLIISRANFCCEYCLMPDEQRLYAHEVDHIIAEKHQGETIAENLCYSCFECNRHKGSDLSSFDRVTGEVVTLFNPRTDHWEDHFRLDGAKIEPQTAKGRVTVFLLHMNDADRIADREALMTFNLYPCQPKRSLQ